MSPWQQIAVIIADTLSCELWMVGHGREFKQLCEQRYGMWAFLDPSSISGSVLITVRLSTFDRQRRLKEVDIGETLKSAKRELFWAFQPFSFSSPFFPLALSFSSTFISLTTTLLWPF
jgi:hypothetical protein